MQLTNFDLFGHPVVVPPVSNPPVRRRVVSEEAKRAKLIRHLEQNNNFLLFEELLDFLDEAQLEIRLAERAAVAATQPAL